MGLFDLFSSTPPATPAATAKTPTPAATPDATPVQPGNIPPNTGVPATAPEGSTPNGIVPVETKDNSPLDQFKDLWEPVSKKEGEQAPASVALDPIKLKELVGKASFTDALTAETLAKISAGGDEAIQALKDSLNSSSQQVMIQSTLAANKMIEQAVATMAATQKAELPALLKQQSLSNNLAEANPLFSNPAIKPVIEAVKSQLAVKNPDATVAELTSMAENFVSVMGEAFSPKPAADTATSVEAINWDKYMGIS